MTSGLTTQGRASLRWTAALSLLATALCAPAFAAECPGRPDAIGTARTIVVDPHEHPRIGTMQYGETLPLHDHEVVLTFDDGPLPRYSNQVLQILAEQCVQATFFIVGSQARANPEGVRKLIAAGHTVGTHSQNHPLTFHKMSIEQAREEVEQGIASTAAALGDPAQLAPFFRIPGLLRADGVEEYAEAHGLQIWSADFPADDWRPISSSRVYDLAIKRLEAKGKGILLLHDIQARTVAALPRILSELKARGYRIVHVVPASPGRPATPTEPQDWQLHPVLETVPIARWPKIPGFDFTQATTLKTPALSDMAMRSVSAPELLSIGLASRKKLALGIVPPEIPWPTPAGAAAATTPQATLPVPAASLFQRAERARPPVPPMPLVRRRLMAQAPSSPPVTVHPAHAEHGAAHGHGTAHAAGHRSHAGGHHPGRDVSRGAKPKTPVRLASLKRRT